MKKPSKCYTCYGTCYCDYTPQDLKIRTLDAHNKREDRSLLCYHMQTWIWKEFDMAMVQNCA
jgi:hypothetical protein